MAAILERVVNLDYKIHLFVAFTLRLALIAYGVYHDRISQVPYTDIDYKVFTDASRYILEGQSPYQRHTYRYTPLVALILIPNIVLCNVWGKLLFSLTDILNAILIKIIVKNTLCEYQNFKGDYGNQGQITVRNRKRSKGKKERIQNPDRIESSQNVAVLIWLYNPLTLAIGTRGNCDSIAVFLVLTTLYLLQCRKSYFLTGLVHGISIHFRLYPIVYSLTFYMYLSRFSFYSDRKRVSDGRIVPRNNERKTIFKKQYLLYLVPNLDQIRLVQGCVLSLSSLTSLFYYFYGYKFLYETYLYHLVRKDPKHNFSLYFYLQYLTAWIKNVGMWQRVLVILPQIVLLLVLSVRYGLNRFSLNFSVLTQTIVFVTYNSVLTSQYFVWILAILPLCLWQINLGFKSSLCLVAVWLAAQGAWLIPAYFLEFAGQNTFIFIWIQGISFFCANIAILGRLIMYFMPLKEKTF